MKIASSGIAMSSSSVSAKNYSSYEKSTVNSTGDTRFSFIGMGSLAKVQDKAVFSTAAGKGVGAQPAAQQPASYKAPQNNGGAAKGFTRDDLDRFRKGELAKIGPAGRGYQVELPDKQKMMLLMLERLTEALTGKKRPPSQAFKSFLDNVSNVANRAPTPLSFGPNSIANIQNGDGAVAADQAPAQPPQAMATVEISETYHELQNMAFHAAGVVNTDDGRQINFDLNVSMSYEFFSANSTQIQRAVDVGQLCDPLVINFDGSFPEFTQDRYSFDIVIGGDKENIFMPTGGSGFLAYDKNDNGLIDDGGELFGAATGNGFAELAAYDGDGNGWIDENDEIFEALKIMSVDKETGEFMLVTLKDAGVGAIFLGSVAGNFEVNNRDNETVGVVRRNGLFLFENGETGSVQHIDLTY
jgi:hypothetical protein